MTHQNIHYQLTKQRTDQSMHSKGSLASFKQLDAFLRKHTNHLTYKTPRLEHYVSVNEKAAIAEAIQLERKLFADYGVQEKPVRGFRRVKSDDYYEEIFRWDLNGDIEQHLIYIDNLGKLPHLKPRPPINIAIVANFWLPGAEQSDTMRSDVYAHLSPTSNKAGFLLNFPHTEINDEFVQFRDAFQADCPVKLEDKYFYIRDISDKGKQSLRKAF